MTTDPETLLADALAKALPHGEAYTVQRGMTNLRTRPADVVRVPSGVDGNVGIDHLASMLLAHAPLRDALTRGLALTQERMFSEVDNDPDEWHHVGSCPYCTGDHDESEARSMNGNKVLRILAALTPGADR